MRDGGMASSKLTAPRNRTKSPGSVSMSFAVGNTNIEEVVMESKFTDHDLEYLPSHPRDAAMRSELVDIDQTFADKNPLKRIMVNRSFSAG